MAWLKRFFWPPKWGKRFSRLMLVLLIVCVLLAQYWRRIDIAHDTTRVTGPITAEGIPDYLAALNAAASDGVTTENNAAPLLLKVVGTQISRHPEHEKIWCTKTLPQIGLLGEPIPPMVVWFEVWIKTAEIADPKPDAEAAIEADTQMRRSPWTRQEQPLWASWLDAHQEALALAHQALERPRFYVPYAAIDDGGKLDRMITMPLLKHANIRGLSNAMLADAMRAAGEGDFAVFESRVTDSLRLARLLAQRKTLIEHLGTVAIEAVSLKALQGVATKGGEGLTGPQARSLLKRIDELPPLPSLAEEEGAVDYGERFVTLDTICAFAAYGYGWISRDPEASNFVSEWLVPSVMPIRYNQLLRQSNAHYDRVIDAYRLPTYPERKAVLTRINDDLRKRQTLWTKITNPSTVISNLAISILAPSFEGAVAVETQMQMNHDLARMALALRIYRLEHGRFPDTLDALSPQILSAIPRDRFSNSPLKYRRIDDGYLLYSVGKDEIDDNGQEYMPNRKTWDIVVRAVE
ncbi:MAG: hypothetical protein FWD53_03315 [Phycisphaerales bacterium]|nr:hypothetical protein [Phycisphaerales bacterium]